MMFTHLAKNMHLRAYWRIQNSHANQSVSISEERFVFRMPFLLTYLYLWMSGIEASAL